MGDHAAPLAGALLTLRTIEDKALLSIVPEHRTDYVIGCLVDGDVLSFDVLLGEVSPAHDYPEHPELHPQDGDVSNNAESGARHMAINQETSLADIDLGLSIRTRACLKRAGVTTLGQLLAMSLEDLVVCNMSRMSVWEIDDLLEEYDLTVFDR